MIKESIQKNQKGEIPDPQALPEGRGGKFLPKAGNRPRKSLEGSYPGPRGREGGR